MANGQVSLEAIDRRDVSEYVFDLSHTGVNVNFSPSPVAIPQLSSPRCCSAFSPRVVS